MASMLKRELIDTLSIKLSRAVKKELEKSNLSDSEKKIALKQFILKVQEESLREDIMMLNK